MSAVARKTRGAVAVVRGLLRDPQAVRYAPKRKERAELRYWMTQRAKGSLANDHYRALFTEGFALDESFFAEKRILDVGCGPRGSLEWATMARERVGLDPLVPAYLRLGADAHAMRYVEGEIEDPPLPAEHFDIVSSINSLDHVNDHRRAIRGLSAVLRPGGTLLVLTELNHAPRVTEPQDFSWEIVDLFSQSFEVIDRLDLERTGVREMMATLRAGVKFDHSDPRLRNGMLRLVLRKPDVDVSPDSSGR